jgi:hypothetical protein
MFENFLAKLFGFLEGKPPKSAEKPLSKVKYKFILDVVDSCKLEPQIASAINWIHYMYRRNFYGSQDYHFLVEFAIQKEEQIINERVHRDFVCPHLKKRADEIADEERKKHMRLVKNESKMEL